MRHCRTNAMEPNYTNVLKSYNYCGVWHIFDLISSVSVHVNDGVSVSFAVWVLSLSQVWMDDSWDGFLDPESFRYMGRKFDKSLKWAKMYSVSMICLYTYIISLLTFSKERLNPPWDIDCVSDWQFKATLPAFVEMSVAFSDSPAGQVQPPPPHPVVQQMLQGPL